MCSWGWAWHVGVGWLAAMGRQRLREGGLAATAEEQKTASWWRQACWKKRRTAVANGQGGGGGVLLSLCGQREQGIQRLAAAAVCWDGLAKLREREREKEEVWLRDSAGWLRAGSARPV